MDKECIEGFMTLRLDDGRELKAYIVSAVHAAEVLASWEAGDCGDMYQAAHGGMLPCAKSAGHEGRCGHLRD